MCSSIIRDMSLLLYLLLGLRLVSGGDPVPFADKVEKILSHVFKNISYDQGTVFEYLLGASPVDQHDPETLNLLRDHLEVSTLDVQTVQKIIEVAKRKLLPPPPPPRRLIPKNITMGQARKLLSRRDLNPSRIFKPNHSEAEIKAYDIVQNIGNLDMYDMDDEQLPVQRVILRRMKQYIYTARDYMGFTKPYRDRLKRDLEYRMGIAFGGLDETYYIADKIHSMINHLDITWVRFIYYLIIYSRFLTMHTDIDYYVQTINKLHNDWGNFVIGVAYKYKGKHKMFQDKFTHGPTVTDIEYPEDRQDNRTTNKRG